MVSTLAIVGCVMMMVGMWLILDEGPRVARIGSVAYVLGFALASAAIIGFGGP